jgi:TRAP-type C4-dicarboxylate transport system permease small subunit
MKKNLILLSLFIGINLLFVFNINFIFAETQFEKGLNATAAGTGHAEMAGIEDKTPAELIGQVINGVLAFLGVIFLILMIYGGYLWMTAAGNEQQVEKAKNIIRDSIIGLIIILAAYAITYFIVNKFDYPA